MLREAIQIIRELFTGELVDWKGEYFEVDSARLWDVPRLRSPIAAAVSGDRSVEMFAPLADHLIAVEPNKDLVDAWHDARTRDRAAGRRQGDRPDPDLLGSRPRRRDSACARSVPLVRRRMGGQLRPADHGRVRRSDAVRQARGRRRIHPVRARIWTRSSTRSASTGRPASPTSRWCRSATSAQELFLKEAAGPLLDKLRTASQ